MIIKFLLLTSYSILLLLSTVGYGILFKNIFLKDNGFLNLSLIGLLGLFSLYLISSITHIFLPHNYFHNTILHLIGLFIAYFFRKEFKRDELKFIFGFFIALFIGLLISKTNEDFPYYHLPFSLQLVEQKLQFGLGNINIAYNHFSSLFHINSVFYLPFVDFYLFNLTNFLFQIFFFSGLLLLISRNETPNFTKIFLSLTLILYLVKFSRLAEYGADLPGQLLALYSVIFCSVIFLGDKILEEKKAFKLFELSLYFLIFAITTKILYSIYLIIPIILMFSFFKIEKIIKYFFNFRFLFISSLSLASLIFYNFASSGCLLYPISNTCFYETISWTLKEETVNHMKTHYNTWSKAGLGAGYGVSDQLGYLENFSWIKNWFSKYFFTKVSDFLLLIIFIILITFFTFKKNFVQKEKAFKQSKNFIFFQILFFIVLSFWFLNFPTLRYAGYTIVFLFLVFPFCLYLSNKVELSFLVVKKKFFVLFVISLLVFNIKNLSRLNNELSIDVSQNHNFSNFPFFWIKDVKYQYFKSENLIYNIVERGNKCWATPSVCITSDGTKTKKIKNYIIHFKK